MRVVDRRETWVEKLHRAGASAYAIRVATALESLMGRPTSKAALAELCHCSPSNLKKALVELRLLGAVMVEKGEAALRDPFLTPTQPLFSRSDRSESLLSSEETESGILSIDVKSDSTSDSSSTEEDLTLTKSQTKSRSNERASFSFGPLLLAYRQTYGITSDAPELVPASAARLAKVACEQFGAERVEAAIRYSPNDTWVARRFLAGGEWPPLSVLLSGNVLPNLVSQLAS